MTTNDAGDRSVPPVAHVIRARAPEVPERRSGPKSGYVGRVELGVTVDRLRRALSKLARDVDPNARLAGAQLAQEAATMLDGLANRAEQASTTYKRAMVRAEKLGKRLDRLRAERGLPAEPPRQ